MNDVLRCTHLCEGLRSLKSGCPNKCCRGPYNHSGFHLCKEHIKKLV